MHDRYSLIQSYPGFASDAGWTTARCDVTGGTRLTLCVTLVARVLQVGRYRDGRSNHRPTGLPSKRSLNTISLRYPSLFLFLSLLVLSLSLSVYKRTRIAIPIGIYLRSRWTWFFVADIAYNETSYSRNAAGEYSTEFRGQQWSRGVHRK